jgi:maleate cis-trans isomerase
MVGWRARLGFLVPAGTPTVEPEMFQLAPRGVSVHFQRMVARGARGTLEGLEERITTQLEHIDESFELLSMMRPDVIVLAHTATSYRLGRKGEQALTERLEARSGVRFITAFGSVIAALEHLGVKRVALGTPYDEKLTLQAKENLESYGREVVSFDWLRNVRSIFEEPPGRVYGLGRMVDRPQAEAVFLSGVGLPTVSVLQALDQDLGKPVISSASAMMWNALRVSRVAPVIPGYGRLLSAH